jgi:hypothetical protein
MADLYHLYSYTIVNIFYFSAFKSLYKYITLSLISFSLPLFLSATSCYTTNLKKNYPIVFVVIELCCLVFELYLRLSLDLILSYKMITFLAFFWTHQTIKVIINVTFEIKSRLKKYLNCFICRFV